eukprot:5760755-Pleurochrysis_carterae.AAC.2
MGQYPRCQISVCIVRARLAIATVLNARLENILNEVPEDIASAEYSCGHVKGASAHKLAFTVDEANQLDST